MFIPSTFKRPVSSWKALNLRKILVMASSVRLKPLNCSRFFFFNDTATTEIYTLSLHDALPIWAAEAGQHVLAVQRLIRAQQRLAPVGPVDPSGALDRKSTRLNSSHLVISYAVFCLKKKKNKELH